MTVVRINKQDAARRQINASIRMTFADEDPVAIHTVISAGHRIVRDICERRGDIESFLRFTDWIKPGHEKLFWSNFNKAANFMKHADNDLEQIAEFDDEISDFMIMHATKWYRDLGNAASKEMKVFAAWWSIQHPEVISPSMAKQMEILGGQSIEDISKHLMVLNRKDRLHAGNMFLKNADI